MQSTACILCAYFEAAFESASPRVHCTCLQDGDHRLSRPEVRIVAVRLRCLLAESGPSVLLTAVCTRTHGLDAVLQDLRSLMLAVEVRS